MEKQEHIRLEDERMTKKLDFMYSYLDFDTDRAKVRTKFLQEMNRKTSLKDIGEILDQLVLDSKAENHNYYNPVDHHSAQASKASKDYSTNDFKWDGKLLKLLDPKTPLFIDDPSQINQVDESLNKKLKSVIERVQFNDD